MSNLHKAGNFLHRMTPGGQSLIKCDTCGQWRGIFTYKLISDKMATSCKSCREKIRDKR